MERTGSLKPSDKIARKQHTKVQTVMRPKCDNSNSSHIHALWGKALKDCTAWGGYRGSIRLAS